MSFGTISASILLSLCLMSGALADCRLDGGSHICGEGAQSTRLLEDTRSPDGAFAVGWRRIDAKGAPIGVIGLDTEQTYLGSNEVDNVLVRLKDGIVIAKLAGNFWPNATAVPSPRTESVFWSSTGRFLLEVSSERDSVSSGIAYEIAPNAGTVNAFDVLALVTASARQRYLGDHFDDGGSKELRVSDLTPAAGRIGADRGDMTLDVRLGDAARYEVDVRRELAGFSFVVSRMRQLAADGGPHVAIGCRQDGDTRICGEGLQTTRILKGSESPDGRWGVGWSETDEKGHLIGVSADVEGASDYLVRLTDGHVIASLSGNYWATETSHLNHGSERIIWSPGGRMMLELADSRYGESAVVLYEIARNGSISEFDVLSLITAVVKRRFKATHPVDHNVENYELFVWFEQGDKLDDRGNMTLEAMLTQRNLELESPYYRINLRRSGEGLTLAVAKVAVRPAN